MANPNNPVVTHSIRKFIEHFNYIDFTDLRDLYATKAELMSTIAAERVYDEERRRLYPQEYDPAEYRHKRFMANKIKEGLNEIITYYELRRN